MFRKILQRDYGTFAKTTSTEEKQPLLSSRSNIEMSQIATTELNQSLPTADNTQPISSTSSSIFTPTKEANNTHLDRLETSLETLDSALQTVNDYFLVIKSTADWYCNVNLQTSLSEIEKEITRPLSSHGDIRKAITTTSVLKLDDYQIVNKALDTLETLRSQIQKDINKKPLCNDAVSLNRHEKCKNAYRAKKTAIKQQLETWKPYRLFVQSVINVTSIAAADSVAPTTPSLRP